MLLNKLQSSTSSGGNRHTLFTILHKTDIDRDGESRWLSTSLPFAHASSGPSCNQTPILALAVSSTQTQAHCCSRSPVAAVALFSTERDLQVTKG